MIQDKYETTEVKMAEEGKASPSEGKNLGHVRQGLFLIWRNHLDPYHFFSFTLFNLKIFQKQGLNG
jgi:hypothetical protein